MKRLLFITSHFGSGYEAIFELMDRNPLVQTIITEYTFSHPNEIMGLLMMNEHKSDSPLATYMTPLLMNSMLSHKGVVDFSKFVYFIRPPLNSLHEMVDFGTHTPTSALNHYLFRMRRIAQLAEMTPGAVFLTWNNLVKKEGLNLVEEYLELEEPLEYMDLEPREMSGTIHKSFIDKAQKA